MTPRPSPGPYCARKRRTGPPAIPTALWWLGRGVRRLAGIDPYPNDERN